MRHKTHTCVGCNKRVSPSGVYACDADLTCAIREEVLGPGPSRHRDKPRPPGWAVRPHGAVRRGASALPELAINEGVLGPGHPDTAASLCHLAGLYQRMGQYEEALLLYQRALVLAINEEVQGPGHPNVDTATCLCNLAGLYDCMGQCK